MSRFVNSDCLRICLIILVLGLVEPTYCHPMLRLPDISFSKRMYLPGKSFRSFGTIALGDCVRECALRHQCQSITYHRLMHACLLNSVSVSATGTPEHKSGFVFYPMTNELRNNRSPVFQYFQEATTCGGIQCEDLQVCRYGDCKYEECPVPPLQSFHGNMFSVGSRLLRTCAHPPWWFQHHVTGLLCGENGVWQREWTNTCPACPAIAYLTVHSHVLTDGGQAVGAVSEFQCHAGYVITAEGSVTIGTSTCVLDEAQNTANWTPMPVCVKQYWHLVFRASAGNGNDVYSAWVDGVGVTTDGSDCTDLTSYCTEHYRHPSVDTWTNLSIEKVKYALYKAGTEAAYVVFNGTDSNSLTDWFSAERIQGSSWSDIVGQPFISFSIEGPEPWMTRRFYTNLGLGGCPRDNGYTVIVTGPGLGCTYDEHGPYPSMLFASGTTAAIFESSDTTRADFAAIFIATTADDMNK